MFSIARDNALLQSARMCRTTTVTSDAIGPQKSVAEQSPSSTAPYDTSFTFEYVDFGRGRGAGLTADALYMQGLLLQKMAAEENAAKGFSSQPSQFVLTATKLEKRSGSVS